MTNSDLDSALGILEWSKQDLCNRLGLHRNTPAGWSEVPKYVSEYLRVCLLLHSALK